MMQSGKELYPVGTNLYDGALFDKGYIDGKTGELVEDDSYYAVSGYIQVSTAYEYTRSYRLYGVFNYDANHNFLGYQGGVNNLGTSVINAFIPGTKYIRTEVHIAYLAKDGTIGNKACRLIRTA